MLDQDIHKLVYIPHANVVCSIKFFYLRFGIRDHSLNYQRFCRWLTWHLLGQCWHVHDNVMLLWIVKLQVKDKVQESALVIVVFGISIASCSTLDRSRSTCLFTLDRFKIKNFDSLKGSLSRLLSGNSSHTWKNILGPITMNSNRGEKDASKVQNPNSLCITVYRRSRKKHKGDLWRLVISN